MNTTNLTTPRVIFLVGIPGAGKTYFATQFAETYGAPYIEAEKTRYLMAEKPAFSGDEQHRLDAIITLQFTELLKTKRTIVFEGGLETRASRIRYARQARAAGYKPLFVWVQTDQATAYHRAVKGGRTSKRDHLISDERFAQLVNQFTTLNNTEPYIVISGKHTYNTQVKTVLRHIAEAAVQTPTAAPRIAVPERRTPQRRISL